MAISTILSTVPSFTFYQTEQEEGINEELPINIRYYHGTIELEQGNESIIISSENVNALFKAIKKNLPEAEAMLNRKYQLK
jgi:hypothetical protein